MPEDVRDVMNMMESGRWNLESMITHEFNGIMGTAFMAGSVFAVTAEPLMVVLCILLAVPGFMGWILPYFLYWAQLRKKSAEVSPLIEDKYEEIYEICEKDSDLLI